MSNKFVIRLRDMQSQIIHGKNTFGEIADYIESLEGKVEDLTGELSATAEGERVAAAAAIDLQQQLDGFRLHLGEMLDEVRTTKRGDWPRHLLCVECDRIVPDHRPGCKIGRAYRFLDSLEPSKSK